MDIETQDALPVRLTKFCLFILGIGIANNPLSQLLLNLFFYNAVLSMAIGFVIVLMDLYYSWGDFYEASHSLIGFIMSLIVLAKFIVIALNYEAFIQLMTDGQKYLWIGNYCEYGKIVMKKYERRSLAFIVFFSSVTQCTSIAYLTEPIIENRMRNESNRMLPFNIWYNGVPLSISPYYEMAFVVQVVDLGFLAFSYFAFDNFLALFNLFIAGHFEILSNRLETLLDDNFSDIHLYMYSGNCGDSKIHYYLHQLRRDFAKCVQQHQRLISLTKKVESVYSFLNLVQTLMYSLLICLIGYQLTLPGIHPARRFKFTSSLTGCIIQLFTFAHTCNNLVTASAAISEGIYNAKWHRTNLVDGGRRLTKDFMLVLMRAQHPCHLTAMGFFPITHDTFKSILSTAFSYLTLMRQSGEAQS